MFSILVSPTSGKSGDQTKISVVSYFQAIFDTISDLWVFDLRKHDKSYFLKSLLNGDRLHC